MNDTIADRITQAGIVAVIVIDDARQAEALAEALAAGGIGAVELTFRTDAAVEALRRMKAHRPDLLMGAGTVLTPAQVDAAREAGADFAVAPGLNPKVIEHARTVGIPFYPGVATASEIEQALDCGIHLLKFFPAELLGGLKMIKALAAPYQRLDLRFIPLGGLNQANMESYLSEPTIAALGGSWIAPREVIAEEAWDVIQQNAETAMATARRCRA